ncbi:hypothetical protein C8R44DRAFT_585502, partial [Mycena epipterygia]
RNLVVSIDGTSNQFGPNNTNVVELHSRIIKDSKDPSKVQLSFYLSGIGTYVPPSWHSLSSWKQSLANTIDLAIAWNFKNQVQDAYRWLADNYQPGDIIYLFGFSRGAYQVRALAGMIATVGLVYPGNQRLIPFAYELYVNRYKGKEIIDGADVLCGHFKTTFARPEDIRVHFVGAWDTVSSVGIFRRQPLPLTDSAEHVCYFRHALAIDERRVRFLPEYVNRVHPRMRGKGDHKQTDKLLEQPKTKANAEIDNKIKEVWFAGSHSDMNITLDLAGVPLLWMENEATSAGLYLAPRPREWKLWDWETLEKEKPKKSLKGFWWFLETIPLTRSAYHQQK